MKKGFGYSLPSQWEDLSKLPKDSGYNNIPFMLSDGKHELVFISFSRYAFCLDYMLRYNEEFIGKWKKFIIKSENGNIIDFKNDIEWLNNLYHCNQNLLEANPTDSDIEEFNLLYDRAVKMVFADLLFMTIENLQLSKEQVRQILTYSEANGLGEYISARLLTECFSDGYDGFRMALYYGNIEAIRKIASNASEILEAYLIVMGYDSISQNGNKELVEWIFEYKCPKPYSYLRVAIENCNAIFVKKLLEKYPITDILPLENMMSMAEFSNNAEITRLLFAQRRNLTR